MGFRLTPLLSDNAEQFTTKQILELLGDTVNDEININGKVYRISSFAAVDSTDGILPAIIFHTVEYIITPQDNNQFGFDVNIDPNSILCTVNGVIYRYGVQKDFHIANKKLIWHGGVDLKVNDQLIIRYPDYNIA